MTEPEPEIVKDYTYDDFRAFISAGVGMMGLEPSIPRHHAQIKAIIADIHNAVPKLKQKNHASRIYNESEADTVLAVLNVHINLMLLEQEIHVRDNHEKK